MTRRRAGLSPTLFPFLAVLVCTLGTLILLLALVAQKAEEAADQLVQSESESARQLAEEEAWQAERLISYRDQQTETLEERRSELAHVEDHIRRLRDEMRQLKDETEAVDRPTDASRAAANEQQLRALDQAIDQATAEIESLREQREGQPPRIVIVPYRGTNGTQRRPIYVECTDEAIVLQPEGVRITADQMGGSLGPGNPIDAALRAIRNHWQQLDANAPPPYPLLLVRPGGIHAYAACRTALDAWDDQFGYELIPADLELAFPQPDTELKQTLIAVIDEAVVRSKARLVGGPPRSNRYAASGSAMPRGGTSGGGGTAASGVSTGSSSGSSMGGRETNASTAAAGTQDSGAGPDGLNPAGMQLGGSTGFGNAGDSRTPGGGSAAGSAGSRIGGELLADADASNAPGVPTIGPTRSPGAGGSSDGTASGSTTQSGGTGGNGTSANTEEPSPAEGGAAMTPPSLTGPRNGSNANSGADSNANEPTAGGDASASAGSRFAGDDAQVTGDNVLAEQQGTNQAGAASGQTSGSGSAADQLGMQSASTSDGGYASSLNGQPPPSDRTFSEAVEERARMRPPSTANRSKNDALPSLSSGNNWALPEELARQRGPTMVRELKLRCAADSLVLEGERGKPSVTVPIERGLIDLAVRKLAGEIRDRVTDWGPAMLGGRWEPVLRVEVMQGGEPRYRQLEMLMRNSGVRIERSPR